MPAMTSLRPFTAVVFDMDGTLLDTELVFKQIVWDVTRDLGFEMTTEVHGRMVGSSHEVTNRLLVEAYGVSFPYELFDAECRRLMRARMRASAERPPSSASISSRPIRAAESRPEPVTSSTTALPAAVSAAQPSASKPIAAMRPDSTVRPIVSMSPQAEPPAAPITASGGTAPRPRGDVAWSSYGENGSNISLCQREYSGIGRFSSDPTGA